MRRSRSVEFAVPAPSMSRPVFIPFAGATPARPKTEDKSKGWVVMGSRSGSRESSELVSGRAALQHHHGEARRWQSFGRPRTTELWRCIREVGLRPFRAAIKQRRVKGQRLAARATYEWLSRDEAFWAESAHVPRLQAPSSEAHICQGRAGAAHRTGRRTAGARPEAPQQLARAQRIVSVFKKLPPEVGSSELGAAAAWAPPPPSELMPQGSASDLQNQLSVL